VLFHLVLIAIEQLCWLWARDRWKEVIEIVAACFATGCPLGSWRFDELLVDEL
jgi:hypothetical protein